jgi:D-cysteine desulfhydrase family pyridoxal phosphate-dependent enzyme
MKNIPCLHFAHLPTPVEPMPRLSAALGGPTLLVKRDDQTGLAFGGNKTRKLEFLLAEAQSLGARRLLTAGAYQSNHCRQTAAAAARFGFECTLVLFVPASQSSGESSKPKATGNLLLDKMFGAEIIWASHDERDQVLQDTFRSLQEAGGEPYLIPYGGSNPTGACGYTIAMQELMSQGIKPDWILFPSSSGGTQAGLVLGAHLFAFPGRVLGISVDAPEDVLKDRVARLATKTAVLLGEELTFSAGDILVDAGYIGGGYGVMGDGEREAIHFFAREEGLLLDPVYTGRAAYGLIDLIRRGFFTREQTVLFWHTGGTPALFADRYAHHLEDL